jgi:hypothetical protein
MKSHNTVLNMMHFGWSKPIIYSGDEKTYSWIVLVLNLLPDFPATFPVTSGNVVADETFIASSEGTSLPKLRIVPSAPSPSLSLLLWLRIVVFSPVVVMVAAYLLFVMIVYLRSSLWLFSMSSLLFALTSYELQRGYVFLYVKYGTALLSLHYWCYQ